MYKLHPAYEESSDESHDQENSAQEKEHVGNCKNDWVTIIYYSFIHCLLLYFHSLIHSFLHTFIY